MAGGSGTRRLGADDDLDDVRTTGGVGRAGPVSDRLDGHRGHRTERIGECRHQRHSGGSGELAVVVDPARRSASASEEFDDGRSRVGEHAVGSAHRAVTDGDRVVEEQFLRGIKILILGLHAFKSLGDQLCVDTVVQHCHLEGVRNRL